MLAGDLHQRALQGGKAAIAQEVATSQYYFERHEFNKADIFARTPAKGGAIRSAGQTGYRRRKKAIRKRPAPKNITVEVSRSRLLRWAHLKTHGGGLKKLTSTLDRLTEPIAGNGQNWPAVLTRWEQLPSGRLRCQVSGQWIATGHFARVPLPLPRSANAKALYLFLTAIRTTSINKVDIGLEPLCERLGIPIYWGSSMASRAINRALDLVNEHLTTLDAEALEDARIKAPGQYQIKCKNGRIRFVAQARPDREKDDDEPVVRQPPPIKRQPPPIKRERLPPEVRARLEREVTLNEIKARIRQFDRRLERSRT